MRILAHCKQQCSVLGQSICLLNLTTVVLCFHVLSCQSGYVVPCCAVSCWCRGTDPSALPSRFAWLVGNLLLHGHLLLPQLANDSSVSDAAEYVGDMRQLQLGPSNSSPEDEPVALVR